jgi:hypothetical protein
MVTLIRMKPTSDPAVLFVVQLPPCPSTVTFTISPYSSPGWLKRWVSPKHLHLSKFPRYAHRGSGPYSAFRFGRHAISPGWSATESYPASTAGLVLGSLSSVSEAPPSEELGVDTLCGGASDTAI